MSSESWVVLICKKELTGSPQVICRGHIKRKVCMKMQTFLFSVKAQVTAWGLVGNKKVYCTSNTNFAFSERSIKDHVIILSRSPYI